MYNKYDGHRMAMERSIPSNGRLLTIRIQYYIMRYLWTYTWTTPIRKPRLARNLHQKCNNTGSTQRRSLVWDGLEHIFSPAFSKTV